MANTFVRAPLFKFDKNWFLNPNFDDLSHYGDTDSITLVNYIDNLMVVLYGPDWTLDDVDFHVLIKYIIRYGEALQANYQDAINIMIKTNASPLHNHMDAKLEVISLGKAYFKKKFYLVAPEIYNEGTSFVDILTKEKTVDNLLASDKFWDLVKKKGGPLVKSDASIITKEMVMEIYQYIARLLIGEVKYTKSSVYNMLTTTIRLKYTEIIKKTLLDKEYSRCVQTKKYPSSVLKTVPKHQLAAKLWNLLVDDSIRAGDTFYVLDIIFLDKYAFQKMMPESTSDFQLTSSEITDILTQISVPHAVEPKQLEHLDEQLKKFNIVIDTQQIIRFNVDMKISLFEPLYSLN